LNVESEVLETVDVSQNLLAFGVVFEVVRAEVRVEVAVLVHVVCGGKHGSSDGTDGLRLETAVEGNLTSVLRGCR
jgi:hypothetical protein